MPDMITVPVTLLDKSAKFAEMSSILVKRSLDEVATHQAAQSRAATLRPAVLDTLLKTAAIRPEQKDGAEAMLGAHDTTMNLLKIAAEQLAKSRAVIEKQAAEIERLGGNAKTAGDLGRPVPGTGSGSGGGSSEPYTFIGQRTDMIRESDRVLLRSIGKG